MTKVTSRKHHRDKDIKIVILTEPLEIPNTNKSIVTLSVKSGEAKINMFIRDKKAHINFSVFTLKDYLYCWSLVEYLKETKSKSLMDKFLGFYHKYLDKWHKIYS